MGGDPGMEQPMGFYLRVNDGTDAFIDIREGDVEAFIQQYAEVSQVPAVTMLPTASQNTGIFNRYLYLTIDGEKYRFERQETMPGGIQAGAQIDTVYEDDGLAKQYRYSVFSVEGCADNSMFLVHSEDMDSMWLYRYSPAKAADPGALQRAKDAGFVVMEDGDVTHGQEVWFDFYEKTRAGTPATVMIAKYHTLDPERCSKAYYEAYREDYPSIWPQELTYDGDLYTLRWNENGVTYVRTYEYLMYYPDGSIGTVDSNTQRYVLTNDNSVTWEELFYSLTSSRYDAFIDHYTVYTDQE